jgi:hypothetical protein
MNQPFSSCLMHFEECINIANTLQSGPEISESEDMGQQSFEPLVSIHAQSFTLANFSPSVEST